MKRELLILLAAVTLTVAMVPRLRRAVNLDEDDFKTATSSSKKLQICISPTPCAWSIYRPKTKIFETRIENSYCICSADMVCAIDEDDLSVNAYIHRCRTPTNNDENAES